MAERKKYLASLLLTTSHLEFLQHGRLVCKAQVAAADTELLGEVVEVHLRGNRRGLWDEATRSGCSRGTGLSTQADLAVVASRHQPQAFLLLVLQEEVLSDGAAHFLQVRHHLLHREYLQGGWKQFCHS